METKASKTLKTVFTFLAVVMALIAFGAESVGDAAKIWKTIFSMSLFHPVMLPEYVAPLKPVAIFGFILVLLVADYWQQGQQEPFRLSAVRSAVFRHLIYVLLTGAILLLGSTVHVEFIYAQF